MRRIGCAYLLFLSLSVAAQQANATAPGAEQTFHVSGVVVNALTGQPLSQVQVAIGLTTGREMLHTLTTGDDGRFDFAVVERGKYLLIAGREGFLQQAFDQHQGFSTAIAVGPNLQSTNLIFRLRPDASISGFVTDEQNDAVPNAQVWLFGKDKQQGATATQRRGEAQTDDRGYYHFAHLPPATYLIAVIAQPWYAQDSNQGMHFGTVGPLRRDSNQQTSAPSPLDVTYPVTYYGDSTDSDDAELLSVGAGDKASADIQLTAVAALHMHVDTGIVPSNAPYGVAVGLSETMPDGSSIQIPVRSIQDGRGGTEMFGVAPGAYTLAMTSFGKQPQRRTESVDISGNDEVNISEAAGSSSIIGSVFLEGKPVRGGVVRLVGHGANSRSAQGWVSAKGDFQLDERNTLTPGKYDVEVFNVPNAVVTGISAIGARVLGHQISIGSQSAVRLKIFMSGKFGEIDGLAERAGKPEAGDMIVLVPNDPGVNVPLFRRDQSDSDGTFSLRFIVPGSYTLIAIQNGWNMEWSDPAALQPYLPHGKRVEVAGQGKYQVTIDVQ